MKAEPFRECPRYQKCNVNNCPLHLSYPDIPSDPDDPDPRCTMEKQVRERIGAKYANVLKYRGLTSREFKGKLRWEAMTPEDQAEKIARAKILHLTRSVKNNNLSAGVGEGAPA